MVIRPARAEEAPTLAAIQCTAALRGFAGIFPADAPVPTPEGLLPLWADPIAEPTTVVLAAVGPAGEVEGGVIASPPTSELLRLYVRPDRWAAGIGARLHDAAVDVLRVAGCDVAELWVLERNTRARAMYERRGWRQVEGITQVLVPLPVVEVRYARTLSAHPRLEGDEVE